MTEGVRTLYLFGAGGHGRELGWLAREALPGVELIYLVDDARYATGPVNGIPVQVVDDASMDASAGFVASVGDSEMRRAIAARLSGAGLTPISLVHPRVERTPTTRVLPGAVVAAGSVLTDDVEVGEHAHVNIGCTLSHDVRIGAYATLSPGVHLAGNVSIGEGAFLGTGAIVINGPVGAPLEIGAGAMVAAGAVVTGPVPAGGRVGGVPARELRSRS